MCAYHMSYIVYVDKLPPTVMHGPWACRSVRSLEMHHLPRNNTTRRREFSAQNNFCPLSEVGKVNLQLGNTVESFIADCLRYTSYVSADIYVAKFQHQHQQQRPASKALEPLWWQLRDQGIPWLCSGNPKLWHFPHQPNFSLKKNDFSAKRHLFSSFITQ